MVLFLLTNCVLDITLGIAWWFTKTSASVLYNGVCYIVTIPNNDNNTYNNSTNNNVISNKRTSFNNYDDFVIIDSSNNIIKDLQNEIIRLKKQLKNTKK